MGSTFGRAMVGFILLTSAVTLMAFVALWALATYGGEVWWASLLVVLIALVAEIGIYSSTLHEPIYDWIKEPKRLQIEQELEERARVREAEANAPIPSGDLTAKSEPVPKP